MAKDTDDEFECTDDADLLDYKFPEKTKTNATDSDSNVGTNDDNDAATNDDTDAATNDDTDAATNDDDHVGAAVGTNDDGAATNDDDGDAATNDHDDPCTNDDGDAATNDDDDAVVTNFDDDADDSDAVTNDDDHVGAADEDEADNVYTILEFTKLFQQNNPKYGITKIRYSQPPLAYVRPKVSISNGSSPNIYICEGLQCVNGQPRLVCSGRTLHFTSAEPALTYVVLGCIWVCIIIST